MRHLEEMSTFVAENNATIVLQVPLPADGQLYYSPDGRTTYQLGLRGFRPEPGFDPEVGCHDGTHLFINPHSGESGEIKRKGDTMYFGGRTFERTSLSGYGWTMVQNAVPLPVERQPLHLLKRPNQFVIYVDDLRFKASAKTVRVFMMNFGYGGQPCAKPIEIRRAFSDNSDGFKALTVETALGTLRTGTYPDDTALFKSVCTWTPPMNPDWPEELEPLDLSRFAFDEEPDGTMWAIKT